MKMISKASITFVLLAFSFYAQAANHKIVIEGMKFNPEKLAVKDGDSVEWMNQEILPHTATAVNKKFDSGVIEAGKSWKTTIKGKGKLEYFCNLHPTMKAVVEVK